MYVEHQNYETLFSQGQMVKQPFCPCFLSQFSIPQTDIIHKYF